MARKPRQDAEAIGSDSFLDVVTNIVGILIILVMVVGIRIKNAPPSDVDDTAAKGHVAQLGDESDALERDVLRLEQQVKSVTFSMQAKHQERSTLAFLVAEHERQLDEAKKQLGSEHQAAFDLRRALAAVENDLKKLGNAKDEATKPKKKVPIQIRSYPTPISHTVFGAEAHFQLKHRRLAWVPLDEMKDLCEQAARANLDRLQSVGEVSDVAGPRQGFQAEWVIERLDEAEHDGRTPVNFSFELVPVSEELGERVEDALRPNSRFRVKLSDFPPRQSTVTLWIYGDSFVDYARVKELLYGLGYQVAARPLPDELNIGASNQGSHSAAQ